MGGFRCHPGLSLGSDLRPFAWARNQELLGSERLDCGAAWYRSRDHFSRHALFDSRWILGFICAASQSLVYLFPDPEETVHQFLWLWVAIAFPVCLAWLANLLLFPVSATRLLQRESAYGWHAVAASAQLIMSSDSAVEGVLRPLVKSGPNRFLKLLKLSLIESPDLRGKRLQLTRLILSVDKIAKLIFSYARTRRSSSSGVAISSSDTAVLGELKEQTEFFQCEFQAGLVPSVAALRATNKTADALPAFQLLEAERTLRDLSDGDTDRLLHLGDSNHGSVSSIRQREQLELEIASRLSEANSYVEQVAFEALLFGAAGTERSRLEETSEGVEEIYVASLPWLREQASSRPTSEEGGDPKTTPELIKLLVDATEALADLIEGPGDRTAGKAQLTTATLLEKEELRGRGNLSSDSLGELMRVILKLQILVQAAGKRHQANLLSETTRTFSVRTDIARQLSKITPILKRKQP
jgi:hypothetical protein